MLGSSGRRGCGRRTRKPKTTCRRWPSPYSAPAATQPLAEEIIAAPVTSLGGLRAKALVALWEALPATASHQGAFDFPDASRSLFEAVAGMTGLLPLVRELEARLEADVESKDVDA
jgi:hypothetical protein